MATAQAKPIEVEFFRLDTPRDFGATLDELLDLGFRGTLQAYVDDRTNQKTWALEVAAANNVVVTATLGDVLIWDGTLLIVMTGPEFEVKYSA